MIIRSSSSVYKYIHNIQGQNLCSYNFAISRLPVHLEFKLDILKKPGLAENKTDLTLIPVRICGQNISKPVHRLMYKLKNLKQKTTYSITLTGHNSGK